jgi:hypothetical protein
MRCFSALFGPGFTGLIILSAISHLTLEGVDVDPAGIDGQSQKFHCQLETTGLTEMCAKQYAIMAKAGWGKERGRDLERLNKYDHC